MTHAFIGRAYEYLSDNDDDLTKFNGLCYAIVNLPEKYAAINTDWFSMNGTLDGNVYTYNGKVTNLHKEVRRWIDIIRAHDIEKANIHRKEFVSNAYKFLSGIYFHIPDITLFNKVVDSIKEIFQEEVEHGEIHRTDTGFFIKNDKQEIDIVKLLTTYIDKIE